MKGARRFRWDALPLGSLAILLLSAFPWALWFMLRPTFPLSILFIPVLLASPFVIVAVAIRLYRRRNLAEHDRLACEYYIRGVVGVIAFAVLMSVAMNLPVFNASLLGSYVPNSRTRIFLEQEMNHYTDRNRIDLRKDGTFTMTDVPDFTQMSEVPTGFLNESGTWKVEGRELTLMYHPASSPGTEHWSGIEIEGAIPPYRLKMIFGDPDMDKDAVFERTAE